MRVEPGKGALELPLGLPPVAIVLEQMAHNDDPLRIFPAKMKGQIVRVALTWIAVMWMTSVSALADTPLDARVVMSGHSLTDPIPAMLLPMVRASGARGAVIERSTIPGSPMDWRWEHRAAPVDARHEIAEYDLLVLTERVPLLNTMVYHNSADEALRWASHAWAHGAATVLYASWTSWVTGADGEDDEARAGLSLRERLLREQARWEEIRDHVNTERPDGMPEMRMIPGPPIMLALMDAIEADAAPGLTDIRDIFHDNIHVNDLGAYLMALAHYAVIYGRDPQEVPLALGRTPVPEPELAHWMQGLVAQVVAQQTP